MPTLLFTPHGLGLLVAGTAVGGVLAATVFAISVISVPLLMTRRVDAVTAIAASLAAVVLNPKPMALWAGLIAGFMALGIATLYVGLIVVFPLIGHATWHAYRDLVRVPRRCLAAASGCPGSSSCSARQPAPSRSSNWPLLSDHRKAASPTRPRKQRAGNEPGERGHRASSRRMVLSRTALAVTAIEEADMAMAASSGVTSPAMASGTNTRL